MADQSCPTDRFTPCGVRKRVSEGGVQEGGGEQDRATPMAEDDRNYCVYILSCSDDSLYTGLTHDLDRRLAEHRAGRGAQWTRRRLPVEVVFSLDGLDYHAASEVERYIKTLPRARKEALIAGNPKMLSLVEKRIVQWTEAKAAKGRTGTDAG